MTIEHAQQMIGCASVDISFEHFGYCELNDWISTLRKSCDTPAGNKLRRSCATPHADLVSMKRIDFWLIAGMSGRSLEDWKITFL